MLSAIMIPLLVILSIAWLTLLERKVLGGVQRRVGPNVVGFGGLLQPIADALKLVFKESLVPGWSNIFIFSLAPVLTFIVSLVNWSVIPVSYGNVIIYETGLGILFIFAISSLGVYGIIMAGWASNSKYAFLGSLRSAAQMISYEVSIGLILLNIVVYTGSLNLTTIVLAQEGFWNIIGFWPGLILFFIAALAETNRIPFDLPEAESELVSGYNVEYSSIMFAFFFLAEYSNIILMSFIIVLFFLGGWLPIFNITIIAGEFWLFGKVILIIYIFILIRGTLPRYRYDQLMSIGWKVLLPISLGYFILNCVLVVVC